MDISAAALLDAAPDPLIVVDRRGHVTKANQRAHALFPTLQNGLPFSFALRNPDVLDALADVLNGAAPRETTWEERRPIERAFAVYVAPLGGQTAAALLHFSDLSEARRIEAMRVDFIANASHELRTPLASVLGFIETLQGPAKDDAVARARFLGIMQGQAQRMARLIDDLLSLSRVELREHQTPSDPLDLVALTQQITDGLKPLATERGVTIAVEWPQTPIVVRGDRDELLRAIENLVENAIKYGASGGRVQIALTESGTDAIVAVKDFGPGIAPEHLPRLTERFYRVDIADSRDKGGTGLGLALVKHIAAHHRGRLQIESQLGEGATFRLVLPRDAQNG
ncbi:MAG: PAS domain-containing protein [Beijerinckiaceae bacterium]|nr:PAS domain-containing protein [Beijerinckiaceae bacterium]